MPLFVCETCEHVDNTALTTGYWYRPNNEPRRCTTCAGQPWHDYFARTRYDSAYHGPISAGRIIDPPGSIVNPNG